MRARSILLHTTLVAAVACGRAAAGRAGLVYYESYDPRSLDPALSTDVPSGEMVTLAFDGLTRFDPDGRLEPALADRWTASRDGRRYVFHLRAGVKFHNGTPLTAGAVRASFLRVLAPGDRKSTRLNSSHTVISYAVFCLKKKNKRYYLQMQK